LLKKGGRTVFFGELGEESSNLVKYFESRGATPIDIGENPVRALCLCQVTFAMAADSLFVAGRLDVGGNYF
jgi:hypothetical protein